MSFTNGSDSAVFSTLHAKPPATRSSRWANSRKFWVRRSWKPARKFSNGSRSSPLHKLDTAHVSLDSGITLDFHLTKSMDVLVELFEGRMLYSDFVKHELPATV